MEKYYFTFGFGHQYPNSFVTIEAEDYGAARDIMFERYGDKWAFQYTEKQWSTNGVSQQEIWHLTEIK